MSVRFVDVVMFLVFRELRKYMIVRFVDAQENTTTSTKQTIISHPNSLNTRNTATSTKQTIIYHPNRTP
jgi:hypothetical protein